MTGASRIRASTGLVGNHAARERPTADTPPSRAGTRPPAGHHLSPRDGVRVSVHDLPGARHLQRQLAVEALELAILASSSFSRLRSATVAPLYFAFHWKYVARLIPCFRSNSATGSRPPPSLRISTIWVSLNRDFRMGEVST